MAFSKKFLLLYFLSFLISTNSFSQTDSVKTYNLSDIVVTATRTETSLLEVASSISIIDSAEIAHSAGISLFGLLKGEYGLTTSQSGGPGQLAQVYLRGADPEHVLVNIDGVKANQPDDVNNSYDFSYISTDNIERIEILRGPQSTLYGSDAMAGVINIITKKGSGTPKYSLNLEGGSLNTYKGMLGTSGGTKVLNYSLTLSRAQSDGISVASERSGNFEKDGYEDYNISTRLGWDINQNTKLNFIARFKKGEKDLDQFGGMFGDDSTYVHNHEQGIYRAEAEYRTDDKVFEQKIGFSFLRNLRKYDYSPSLFNPYYSKAFYSGNSYQLDFQSNFRGVRNNIITFGVDLNKQARISAATYDETDSFYPKKEINTVSVYLQDQISIAGASFTTLGIRYDKYGDIPAFTFRIAQAYFIEKTGTKLKAVYGTAFKAPSLFNLYDPAYGNPDLENERNKGWEVGVEQYLFDYRMQAGVNYFSYKFSNMFGYDENFRTININSAEINGAELFLTSHISNSFTVNANYTYTDAKDKSSAGENLPLIRRPEHSASLKINYSFIENITVNLNIQYVGVREDQDFSTFPSSRIELTDYTLVGLAAAYSITKFLQVYGRVENLLDKKYEEVLGYGTTGLTAYTGIRLNIN
ncbi:MAG: TonB-dependent receptor [Ignavibacteriaceae bacterium]